MRAYTLDDVLGPYRGYPKAIQQAILLAHTHPAFLVLTRGTRKVLCALLTRASKDNGMRGMKARVDRLAEEASVSTKTVQRALGALRELGWLALPDDEGRSEYGVFCSRSYHFTASLCELVRLPCTGQTSAEVTQETKMSDGAVYVDLTFKEDQRKISIEKSKGKPVDLPKELQDAAKEFCIKDTGIALLRGLAHREGHRLESIVAVARAYLRKSGATGHRAFRYLQAMASRPVQLVDYASRAAQAVRLAGESAVRESVQAMEARCRYKQFLGPGGVRVRVFDGTAEVFSNNRYKTVAGKDMEQIFARIRTGWLREVYA